MNLKFWRKKTPTIKYKRCLLRLLDNKKTTKTTWLPTRFAKSGGIVEMGDGQRWYVSMVCPEKLTEKEVKKRLTNKGK